MKRGIEITSDDDDVATKRSTHTSRSNTDNRQGTMNTSTHALAAPVEASNAANILTPSIPWPGKSFAIRLRGDDSDGSSKFVAVKNDTGGICLRKLQLAQVIQNQACHWVCVEISGWLGLKHAGRYLGWSDYCHLMVLRQDKHDQASRICVRAYPDGGYVWMMKHKEQMLYVGSVGSAGTDSLSGEETSILAAKWDFIRV